MKKWLIRAVVILLLLILLGVLFADFLLSRGVKMAVETVAPQILRVPVKLDSAEFRLIRGYARLRGFEMGNPEGFKTERAIAVGELLVVLDVRSLLTDTVRIRRIYIAQPEITYELALGKSNIGTILESLESGKGGEPATTPEPEKQKTSGAKKTIIDDLVIKDPCVRLSATLAGGAAAPMPLPDIHLKDIGKEKGGASFAEVLKNVLASVLEAVEKAVLNIGGAVKDASESLLRKASEVGAAAVEKGKEAGKLLERGTSKIGEGLKDLLEKAKPEK